MAAPLWLGSGRALANATLCGVLAACLWVCLWLRPATRRWPWPWGGAPIIAVLVALSATLLQLVPLPLSWVAVIAPKTASFYQFIADHTERRWFALALDPSATALAGLQFTAAAFAAYLAVVLFDQPAHRRTLLTWIGAAGATTTLLGFIHALVGFNRPYGAYGVASRVFTASFICPNHLAAFLGFSSLICLALAWHKAQSHRLWWTALSVLTGAGVVLTLSRGAMISYCVALIALGVGLWRLGREQPSRQVFVVLGVAAGVFALAAFLAFTPMVHELWTLGQPESLSKTQLWAWVPRLVRDFPLSGVGRGAFGQVVLQYLDRPLHTVPSHLENEWLQPFVDYGFFGGVLGIALAGWSLYAVLKQTRARATTLATFAALLFLAIHNLGDFNFALSALLLPAVMVAACHAQPRSPFDAPRRPAWILGALLTVVALLLGSYAIAYDLRRDTARLQRLINTDRATPAASAQFAWAVVARHPADFFLPFLLGQAAVQQTNRSAEALTWINRSMWLAPHYGPAHLIAAQALGLNRAPADQVLLEYQLALQNDATLVERITQEVWQRRRNPHDLAAVATDDAKTKIRLARFLMQQRPAATAAIDAAITTIVGEEPAPEDTQELMTLRVEHLLHLGQWQTALQQAVQIQTRFPASSVGYRLAASAAVGQGDLAGAHAVLVAALDQVVDPEPLLRAQAGLFLDAGDFAAARNAATTLLQHTGGGAYLAEAHGLLARISEREARPSAALRHFEQAKRAQPHELRYRLSIARLYAQMGNVHAARAELLEARHDLGDVPALNQALERLNNQVSQQQEQLRWQYWLSEPSGDPPLAAPP